MGVRTCIAAIVIGTGGAAVAQVSAEFPRDSSYIIQLTGSGLGDYIVPPLLDTFGQTGIEYEGGPGADFAASVETGSDVGAWYNTNAGRVWLYERYVVVGLSPADADIEPEGRLTPWFAVKVILKTENEDRLDELDCLIRLASAELAARYRLRGAVTVDGTVCARQ